MASSHNSIANRRGQLNPFPATVTGLPFRSSRLGLRRAAGAFIVSVVLSPSSALAADICAALLAQGIRDTSSQQVTEARFNELKSNVCNTNYDTYAKAASQAASGGFDLPGVFGISFGSSSASAEYETKWSRFCQSDYGRAISNSELKTYFSTANRAVLNSFDSCVNLASERFVRYVEPQPDGRTYSMTFENHRVGNSTFRVLAISLTNSTMGTTMNVLEHCDVPPPFKRDFPWDTGVPQLNTNAFSITCRKEPGHTIVVNATTSAGNISPVVVKALPNPGPTLLDRVDALEANLAAAVPSGSILTWFSTAGSVPSGWGICYGTRGPDLRNFFLRGANSSAELNNQTRGRNTHEHNVDGPTLRTSTPRGAENKHVVQNGSAALTVYGTDHRHNLDPFSTGTADNLPEYKSVLFLCR
jgi:hypothetical protein